MLHFLIAIHVYHNKGLYTSVCQVSCIMHFPLDLVTVEEQGFRNNSGACKEQSLNRWWKGILWKKSNEVMDMTYHTLTLTDLLRPSGLGL